MSAFGARRAAVDLLRAREVNYVEHALRLNRLATEAYQVPPERLREALAAAVAEVKAEGIKPAPPRFVSDAVVVELRARLGSWGAVGKALELPTYGLGRRWVRFMMRAHLQRIRPASGPPALLPAALRRSA